MIRGDFDYTDAADTALEKQLEDMTVQAAFWKQCAENAITGWLQQEDVSIALREKLVEMCRRGLMHVHHDSVSGLAFRDTINAATADADPEEP